ncbi:hypothetical protein OEZ60_08205 [Defluviimonas sp. WL0024]|uniref:Uncharacterized protein n=1 Tax=Albidovulum salinarum TaxID=2984153 RepID=A0ABT2X4R9_9RHOB|nr:hypothetical protein [Defluviimonas sp. WL0024]MCU9847987.1 hypothetical protein [Defluviimonas sp. WL0024]
MTPAETLAALETGTLDPAGFTHRDHVLTAWEALRRDDFFIAACRYASAIRRLAQSCGRPEKYSATITLAFLSLIAERMEPASDDAERFLAENPGLLAAGILEHYYSAERLASARGRRVALLPDRAGQRVAPQPPL